jgi:uncharacterized membrane protein
MLPLHPIVVHFPIVLAVLLPIFALGALWAIRKGTTPLRAWSVPAALAAALALSAFVAVQTGETEDERVESVVPDQPLETHEEAAESFLMLSGGLALLTAAGLVRGRIGGVARGLGTAGAVGLVAVAAYVGHSGGKLVYEYGAASAHTGIAARTTPTPRQNDAADGDDR